MAAKKNSRSALIVKFNALKPPHQSHAAIGRILDLVDIALPRVVGDLPMHAALPRNARKLADIEAHLQAAARLIEDYVAEETPRMRLADNGDIVLSPAEQRYYRRRNTLATQLMLADDAIRQARA